jgi:hypothetical protein
VNELFEAMRPAEIGKPNERAQGNPVERLSQYVLQLRAKLGKVGDAIRHEQMVSLYQSLKSIHVTTPEPSSLRRVLLKYGKWFGAGFVPDNTLQVIYTNGLYAGVRGPGQFRYNRFTETLGPEISITPQRRAFIFTEMLSLDSLRWRAPQCLVRLRSGAYGCQLVHHAGNPAESGDVFAERATRVCQPAQFMDPSAGIEAIEEESHCRQTWRRWALPTNRPVWFAVRLPPPRPAAQQNAQRRAQILAGEEFNPSDYRALITSSSESARTGAGESIINFNEMISDYG